jgi:hypothetical protein
MTFEALFKSAIVAVVPQPHQIPPSPFGKEDLQRIFMDVTRDYSYQTFGYVSGGGGAQFANSLDDTVVIQPGVIQMMVKMDGAEVLTAERATQKVDRILTVIFDRLGIRAFLQCQIKAVAHVPAPGEHPDARTFVAERLMRGDELAAELGAGFFGGGVRYRRIDDPNTQEILSVEPLVLDKTFIYVEHDVARVANPQPFTSVESVTGWLSDSFAFVSGPAMGLLNH